MQQIIANPFQPKPEETPAAFALRCTKMTILITSLALAALFTVLYIPALITGCYMTQTLGYSAFFQVYAGLGHPLIMIISSVVYLYFSEEVQ